MLSLGDEKEIKTDNLKDIDFFANTNIIHNQKLFQTFYAQMEGSFGERMKKSIQWAFNLKFQKLIILGADSPQIQPYLITEAIRMLDENDVVLGPSAEGGIYLIGIKPNLDLENFENLFEGVELSNFAKFADAQSLNIMILPELVDVDQESDLVGLIAWIESIEIQKNQKTILSSNDKISIPKQTLSVIRKIGLSISVNDSNNRRKKITISNSIV